jgi:hypothetical protein
LSRFYFKLIYRARKSNKRADALSRKHKDIKEQGKVIKEYKTQVLLLKTKIDFAIIQDLQLALVNLILSPETMLKLRLELKLKPTIDFTSLYNSI